jgi:hypothetical protein
LNQVPTHQSSLAEVLAALANSFFGYRDHISFFERNGSLELFMDSAQQIRIVHRSPFGNEISEVFRDTTARL